MRGEYWLETANERRVLYLVTPLVSAQSTMLAATMRATSAGAAGSLRTCTNHSSVSRRVNQSEASIVACQPIRSQYYRGSLLTRVAGPLSPGEAATRLRSVPWLTSRETGPSTTCTRDCYIVFLVFKINM